jgi:hypothetical protein
MHYLEEHSTIGTLPLWKILPTEYKLQLCRHLGYHIVEGVHILDRTSLLPHLSPHLPFYLPISSTHPIFPRS